MKCVTYKNVIRTNPGGADAHMRTHDREIEVPAVVPSHRRVKNGLTTVKIARLSQIARLGEMLEDCPAEMKLLPPESRGLRRALPSNLHAGARGITTLTAWSPTLRTSVPIRKPSESQEITETEGKPRGGLRFNCGKPTE